MRKIRYSVAASLDGYIAGPKGEIDWIVSDPDVDFAALFDQFDTLVMGRLTFEEMVRLGQAEVPGTKIVVFSNSLRQEDWPLATIVSGDPAPFLQALRATPGKDIWIFGGGAFFRSVLQAGLVDAVEVAVMPVLLGGGISLLPAPAPQTKLKLTGKRVYGNSGIVFLTYDVLTS
jgi:dihydrofolate reductase